ncbi:MFS transporter [Rickettsia bellii]|uniref:Sugar (And other) transporter family protein n=1 Tax=Rickettsia bellii str. RML An4 TaxID=1359193 RepID=A0A0F3QDL1_RICBE|nr:MFS transporter [Rickettsia bellii]ARD86768.1 MFS transporter [Rickettsia bellii]KJV89534.1 sugar (and other) transporter family protein [Rickettsia bellii str. RML An4]
MLGYAKEQTTLTREQKEAAGILSTATFLEYFDLMLYVHLAVLLNELFFPKYEPSVTSFLSAFTFCSTFIFRPLGAYIFGRIGDKLGRKSTVIMTTTLMALSCVVMANAPTYEQIGYFAAVLITVCRAVQGMASVGEIVGAELYLTEITKPPVQYPFVSFIAVASVIGTTAALAVASLVTTHGLNWRIAFWIGAAIAVIGGYARTKLRETPDFVNASARLLRRYEKINLDTKALKHDEIFNQKPSRKTTIYFFIMSCAWPICFYYTYITCGEVLKNSFGYSASQVIHHNFIISMFHLAALSLICFLSYKIYPLKILRVKLALLFILILSSPYLLGNVTTPIQLLLIQICIISCSFDTVPAVSIFFRHFPVFKRFTYSSMIYAISRALMYVITSFGIIYLTKYFGQYGLFIVMVPLLVTCMFGLNHFQELEKKAGYL